DRGAQASAADCQGLARAGAGALHRGGLPGHRQQRGRARDEADCYWSQLCGAADYAEAPGSLPPSSADSSIPARRRLRIQLRIIRMLSLGLSSLCPWEGNHARGTLSTTPSRPPAPSQSVRRALRPLDRTAAPPWPRPWWHPPVRARGRALRPLAGRGPPRRGRGAGDDGFGASILVGAPAALLLHAGLPARARDAPGRAPPPAPRARPTGPDPAAAAAVASRRPPGPVRSLPPPDVRAVRAHPHLPHAQRTHVLATAVPVHPTALRPSAAGRSPGLLPTPRRPSQARVGRRPGDLVARLPPLPGAHAGRRPGPRRRRPGRRAMAPGAPAPLTRGSGPSGGPRPLLHPHRDRPPRPAAHALHERPGAPRQ